MNTFMNIFYQALVYISYLWPSGGRQKCFLVFRHCKNDRDLPLKISLLLTNEEGNQQVSTQYHN